MVAENLLVIILPIVSFFGAAFWVMIFLNNYSHFSKIHKGLQRSIITATILTLILVVVVCIFLWFILQFL